MKGYPSANESEFLEVLVVNITYWKLFLEMMECNGKNKEVI